MVNSFVIPSSGESGVAETINSCLGAATTISATKVVAISSPDLLGPTSNSVLAGC